MHAFQAPLFSLVVPTKDRHDTLLVLVKHVLSWPDTAEVFEVIVEDNSQSASPFLSELGTLATDPRLKYRHDNARRSAVENCDAAVDRATGLVVCFIGDDDGISRSVLRAANWMKRTDVEALVVKASSYTWPNMSHAASINYQYNGIHVEAQSHHLLEKVDIALELEKVMRSGAQSIHRLPCVYHSLVQRTALLEIKGRTGSYFPGPVPDMSNALALSQVVTKCYWTDVPFTVSGVSPKSMSGRNSVRGHQGSLEGEKSLPDNISQMWDDRIPKYWSGPTIWSATALYTIKKIGRQDLLKRFSFKSVYAACFSYNERKYRPAILAAIRTNGKFSYARFALPISCSSAKIVGKRGKVFLGKLWPSPKGRSHNDIASVMDDLDKRLDTPSVNNLFDA